MATPGALPQPALPPLPHLQAVTGRRERGGGEDIMHSPHIIQANVGALAERDLEGEFLGRKHASQLTAAWKHVTVDGAPSDGGFFSARCKAKRNSQKWWAAACVCVCVCVRTCVRGVGKFHTEAIPKAKYATEASRQGVPCSDPA